MKTKHGESDSLSPAVITELNHVVLIAVLLCTHNEAEQGVLLLLSINHHFTPKEPVPTVLTKKEKI